MGSYRQITRSLPKASDNRFIASTNCSLSGVTVQHIARPCEIVSLNGTVSAARCHLHIALSREDLTTLGGHLMEGTFVNTTCELVLLELDGWRCGVEQDAETGYDEIVFQEEP